MREKQARAGYQEVNTPEILNHSLWLKSGHAEKFGENMYLTQTPDERLYAVKPMNCPGHIQVFKQGIKSYRDLPYYIAEFGKVHRYEPSGALHGIMRVRAFTQDDAHVFCTEAQIAEECVKASRLIYEIYRDFGFEDVVVKFSDRPEQRVGSLPISAPSLTKFTPACPAPALPLSPLPPIPRAGRKSTKSAAPTKWSPTS
jgi:threonyl-tRNA synthetase